MDPNLDLILRALAPLLAGVAAYFASKASANNREMKIVVEQIHTAVNSERSEMVAKVQKLHDEMFTLAKENATMKEHAQGLAVATALATPTTKDRGREDQQ